MLGMAFLFVEDCLLLVSATPPFIMNASPFESMCIPWSAMSVCPVSAKSLILHFWRMTLSFNVFPYCNVGVFGFGMPAFSGFVKLIGLVEPLLPVGVGSGLGNISVISSCLTTFGLRDRAFIGLNVKGLMLPVLALVEIRLATRCNGSGATGSGANSSVPSMW